MMKKQDILDLLEEKKKQLEYTKELGKEKHDCIFSIALLKYEGAINILEEILEKFYQPKKIYRKEPLQKRLEKSLEWLNLRLPMAIEKRNNCKSTDIEIHFKRADRVSKINKMIDDLKEKIKKENEKKLISNV